MFLISKELIVYNMKSELLIYSNVLYNLFAFFDVLGQIHFCSLYESYYEQSEFSRLYAKV